MEGVEAPRGTLFGEHTWITLEGMRQAGLMALANTDHAIEYFTDGHFVGQYETIEPAPAGAGRELKRRPFAIQELSQIPDVSYGMATGSQATSTARPRTPPGALSRN